MHREFEVRLGDKMKLSLRNKNHKSQAQESHSLAGRLGGRVCFMSLGTWAWGGHGLDVECGWFGDPSDVQAQGVKGSNVGSLVPPLRRDRMLITLLWPAPQLLTA